MANSPYIKYMWAYLLALGQIPNPYGTAKDFETTIKALFVDISGTLDPELPDGYLSLVLPVLKAHQWSDKKIAEFVKSMLSLELSISNPSTAINTQGALLAPTNSSSGDVLPAYVPTNSSKSSTGLSDVVNTSADVLSLLFPGVGTMVGIGATGANAVLNFLGLN
jgi:hypothetical protein